GRLVLLACESSERDCAALPDLQPAPPVWSEGGLDACQMREGAGDGGGAAGDAQLFVDVFQGGANRSLGDALASGCLGLGLAGGEQAERGVLPGGEPGDWVTAPRGVQVGEV